MILKLLNRKKLQLRLMKVKNSTGRSSKPVDVDCHKVSCSYSGYMYLSECPSVIQLSLNVKTMNHPDLSVGWSSGGGGYHM